MASPTKFCTSCGFEKPRFSGRWCADCEREYEPLPPVEPRTSTPKPVTLTPEPSIEAEPEPSDANQRRYRDRKAKGQCQRCDQPARPGRVTCADCARKQYEAAKARQARIGAKATRRRARSGAKG